MRYVLGVETDPDGQIAKGFRGAHRPSRGGTSGTELNERILIKCFNTPLILLTLTMSRKLLCLYFHILYFDISGRDKPQKQLIPHSHPSVHAFSSSCLIFPFLT